LIDIQESIEWYENQSIGLGLRFQKQVVAQINMLKTIPQANSIRYTDTRCLRIKNFPFLVHYTISESLKMVDIFAVLHPSRNPKIWEKRKPKS
jgi:ParE toxin of type II toxin-antitoxin system, parDE